MRKKYSLQLTECPIICLPHKKPEVPLEDKQTISPKALNDGIKQKYLEPVITQDIEVASTGTLRTNQLYNESKSLLTSSGVSSKSVTPRIGYRKNGERRNTVFEISVVNANSTSFHNSIQRTYSKQPNESLKRTLPDIPLESFKEQAKKKKKRIREEMTIMKRVRLMNEIQGLRDKFNKKKELAIEDMLRKAIIEKGINRRPLLTKFNNSPNLMPSKIIVNKNNKLKMALQNYLKLPRDNNRTDYQTKGDYVPIKLLKISPTFY